jgi:hypothetical protein
VIIYDYSHTGLSQISFSVPVPECLNDAVFLGGVFDFPSDGSPESGVTVYLGDCLTGHSVNIGRLLFAAGVDSCCPIGVLPHPASLSGNIEALDCDSNLVDVTGWISTVMPRGFEGCGAPTMPSDPIPPDGAENLPLNVTLGWDSEPTAGTGLGVFFANVHFGTSPDSPIYLWNIDPPQTVGPLEPNTVYYWKVDSIVTAFGSTEGPVWSFTTGPNVPVENTTWGAIKALYK